MRTHPFHEQWKEQQANEAMRRLLLARAAPEMLEALKTTAGNIKSLRAAGVNGPFNTWLVVVERAIDLAEGRV